MCKSLGTRRTGLRINKVPRVSHTSSIHATDWCKLTPCFALFSFKGERCTWAGWQEWGFESHEVVLGHFQFGIIRSKVLRPRPEPFYFYCDIRFIRGRIVILIGRPNNNVYNIIFYCFCFLDPADLERLDTFKFRIEPHWKPHLYVTRYNNM